VQCETVQGGLHGNKLIIATARKMWQTGGIRAFYKGILPGLAGVFPYAAIDMGTFEFIKMRITDRNVELHGMHEDDAGPSSVTMAAMGGFTGALGATMVYPVNLVRTRLQSQGTVLHPRTYNGFWDATRVTIKGEGFGGLFKGLVPNLIKVVPAVSIVSHQLLQIYADRGRHMWYMRTPRDRGDSSEHEAFRWHFLCSIIRGYTDCMIPF
jgi:solute carrier family 25 phosphate transporter 23/24/25/41